MLLVICRYFVTKVQTFCIEANGSLTFSGQFGEARKTFYEILSFLAKLCKFFVINANELTFQMDKLA